MKAKSLKKGPLQPLFLLIISEVAILTKSKSFALRRNKNYLWLSLTFTQNEA
jgi:hypothetical protein